MAELPRNSDGSIAWATGLDWEIATQPDGSYVACLYDKTQLLATVTGRNRLWLALRMWWVKRRHG